ncbi:hypothetical protein P280DRAFT_524538 [Massarina eburnea CBS 473.64]|uniref:Uncharacterized protein n=1 Tax=Massarina eburnea CBS 473.64 TaxID=1395130 RepID=A0A6A6RJ85_9PLEO|nr:hypothetical protein P280DRAFT_524538 [Massarina eburnea CBS 473.64]
MSNFGTKEAWMEPMNAFLTTHRLEFKTYLDSLCGISTTTSPAPHIPPSYSTPLAILQRLPPTSREGFPSLPYLVDHARNFAALVDLWLDNTQSSAENIRSTDGDLLNFHKICVALRERTGDCLNRAERAERPSSTLSVKWEELVEQLQGSASFQAGRGAATKSLRAAIKEEGRESLPTSPNFDEQIESSATTTPINMKPTHRSKRHHQSNSISASATSLSSITSAQTTPNANTTPFSPKARVGYALSLPDTTSQSASTTASASVSDGEITPPRSSDGLHMAPPPSYPHTHTHPSGSTSSFHYVNPNLHINPMPTPSAMAMSGAFSNMPHSAGRQSYDASDGGSMQEEDATTALPAFSEKSSGTTKDRKGGFRGVLPFNRKRKDKDKDRDKEKEKEEKKERKGKDKERKKDRGREERGGRDEDLIRSRDRSSERNIDPGPPPAHPSSATWHGHHGRGGSALGEYASHSSLRGWAAGDRDRVGERERMPVPTSGLAAGPVSGASEREQGREGRDGDAQF